MNKLLGGNSSVVLKGVFQYEDSKSRHEEVHTFSVHHKGKHLILQSLRNCKSYCIIKLVIDELVATGSWEMQGLSIAGHKSTRVWGAVQLILDNDSLEMQGMWLGFGSELLVKSGKWSITPALAHPEKLDSKESYSIASKIGLRNE